MLDNLKKYKVILASNSPRRKELLAGLGVEYEVRTLPDVDESYPEALKGAEKTIKKYKPKLAIAGYHKTWDLWRVPQVISEMNSGYKIYLRSYMNNVSFVYYCC